MFMNKPYLTSAAVFSLSGKQGAVPPRTKISDNYVKHYYENEETVLCLQLSAQEAIIYGGVEHILKDTKQSMKKIKPVYD
jgi:hypothetical protein